MTEITVEQIGQLFDDLVAGKAIPLNRDALPNGWVFEKSFAYRDDARAALVLDIRIVKPTPL